MGEPSCKLLHFSGCLAKTSISGQVFCGVGFGEEHFEVGSNHPVSVLNGGQVVASRRGVLGDLAKDPWPSAFVVNVSDIFGAQPDVRINGRVDDGNGECYRTCRAGGSSYGIDQRRSTGDTRCSSCCGPLAIKG